MTISYFKAGSHSTELDASISHFSVRQQLPLVVAAGPTSAALSQPTAACSTAQNFPLKLFTHVSPAILNCYNARTR
jgi:hypothetical protein